MEDEWMARLKTLLNQNRPIHLIGVGNPIRGDDALGLFIASKLRKRLGARPSKLVKIHESSIAPEFQIAKISKLDSLIIFDAVEHNSEPGSIIFANLGDTRFGYFATHNIPMKLIPNISENMANIFVLGIQPGNVHIGEGLTKIVLASANQIVERLAGLVEETRQNGLD